MNFTAIWERISPYINISAIVALASAAIGVLIKMLSVTKAVKQSSKDLTESTSKMFAKAIPKEMTISVKSLVKKELEEMLDKVVPVITAANEHNSTLIRDIAMALCSLHTVSDTAKANILTHLGKPVIEDKLKLEMNAEFEELISGQTDAKNEEVAESAAIYLE